MSSCYQDFYNMLLESLPFKLFWHCKSNQIAGNLTYCKMYCSKFKRKCSLGGKTFWLQLSDLHWLLPSSLFSLSPKSKSSLRSNFCSPKTLSCLLLFLPFFSGAFKCWTFNDLYKKMILPITLNGLSEIRTFFLIVSAYFLVPQMNIFSFNVSEF